MDHATTWGFAFAAGAASFAGVLHVIVWLRQPNQRAHLWFGIFCILSAFGMLGAIGAYHSESAAEAVSFMRWRFSALCTASVIFYPFLVSYTRIHHREIFLVLISLLVFLLAANMVAPHTLHYESVSGFKKVALPWGERISVVEGTPNPLLLVAMAAAIGARAYLIVLAVLCYRQGDRMRGMVLLVCTTMDFAYSSLICSIDLQSSEPLGYHEFTMGFYELNVFFWIIAVNVHLSEEFRRHVVSLEAANKNLREGENRFRTLVQNIPGVVYRSQPKPPWRMEHISEGVEALSGYRAAEFMGEEGVDWNDLIVPEDVPYVERLVEEAISQQEPYEFDYRIRDAQGTVRWVHERGRAILDGDKNTLLLDGIILDVSDQRALEHALEFVAQGAWTQSQDTFFPSLVSYLAESLDVGCAIVGQLSGDGATVEAIASVGLPDDERIVTCQLAGTPSEQVIGKRPRYYPADLCRQFPQDPWLGVMQARAYIGVPLWDSDSRPLGVLSVLSTCPIERPPLVLSILQAVAPRVAAELEQKRAEERVLKRVREIAGLSSLGRRINSTLAVREVTEIALEDLFTVSSPDIAFFCEWDDNRLRPVASCSDSEGVGDAWLKNGARLCQFVAETRRSVFWACPYSAPQGVAKLCEQMGVVSFGAIPLMRDEKLLGVLALISTGEERRFGKQVAFLEAFCNTVAIGLRNAQLFEEANKVRETLERRNTELETEIAERCRIEEALRESEQMIRALVETSQDWIWVADVTEAPALTYSNPAAKDMLGYEPEEILGESFWKILHPDDAKWLRSMLPESIEKKQGWTRWILRFRHKDGTWRSQESSAVPILDAKGRLIGYRGIDRDITERLRAEERLGEMEAQLTHAGRLSVLGEMVAGIAHEINQPLYSIVNFAKACRNVLAGSVERDGGDLVEWNGEIVEAASRATEIIKRLRQFARKGTGNFSTVHVDELIEESVELMAFELRRKGVEVCRDLAPDVPSVSADRIQIEQVLVNLLQNACEAMAEAPKVDRQVFLRTRQNHGYVEISVEDRGPGLREEKRFTIFEPFVTTKEDGLGMGLAISTTIVEAHGGRLWATSGREGGAAFHLLLPCT